MQLTLRIARIAPLVAGALLAVPSLVAHYLPMSDLPLHEGAVGLLRHFGDDTYVTPGLYRLNLGHPNQLFYLVAWLLSYVVGTVWAVKLVVATAQFAIFWSGARLADHLGRSRWSVLLLAPLALGFTFFWGLTPNLLGFAALLSALPALDRAAAEPRARGVATSCAWLLLTFLAHESSFMAAAGFVVLLAALYPLERRKTSMRLAPVVFALALAVGHQIYAARFFTRALVTTAPRFPSVSAKLSGVPYVLFGAHDAFVRLILLGISVVAVGLLLRERLRSKEPAPEDAGRPPTDAVGRSRLERVQDVVFRYRYELTGGLFLSLYLVVPFNWKVWTMLYERFLGPAWALLVICAAPRGEPPRLAKLLSGVLPVAVLLVSWPQFADADATFRDLDTIIAAIPKNSAVALTVVGRATARTRAYSPSIGPGRILADRGGRVALSLGMAPIAPVQTVPEYRWDDVDRRVLANGPGALQPSHDLDRFGWVVVQSCAPEQGLLAAKAFKPDAELVMVRGEWLLFRSTHVQVPLTSPEAEPDPQAQTLSDRMNATAGQHRRAQQPRLGQ